MNAITKALEPKAAKLADALPPDHPWRKGQLAETTGAQIGESVTLRDTKAERQAQAIANRDAAGEAAGIISTVLAPENEAAHVERELSVKMHLLAIADQFGGHEEYCGQAVLEVVCNRFDYLVAAKRGQIQQAVGELAALRRRFKGDEVTDTRMLRKLDWIEKCEAQRDGSIDVLRAACAAYKELTGDTWVPRQSDPVAAAQMAKTAAAASADEKLKRYDIKKMPARATAEQMHNLRSEPRPEPNLAPAE